MQYKFNIGYSEQDYLDFNLFHLINSPQGKKNIKKQRTSFIIISIITAILLIICFALKLKDSVSIMTIAFILSLFLTIFYPKLLISGVKNNVKQSKADMPLYEDCEIEFFENCIVEVTENKRLELKYPAIKRACVLNGKVVYLYIMANQAIILPFRVFNSQEQCNFFFEFLKTKVANIEFI